MWLSRQQVALKKHGNVLKLHCSVKELGTTKFFQKVYKRLNLLSTASNPDFQSLVLTWLKKMLFMKLV